MILGGEGLEPSSSATTVRVRDGERVLSDGPFAETKEQLGGFYLLECDSLDEAIGWAAKIPGAATGSVEVRPVMNYEGAGKRGRAAIGGVLQSFSDPRRRSSTACSAASRGGRSRP